MIKGIGCDIVSIKRLTKVINKTPAFLTRVYSKAEIAEYHKRNNNVSFLATRFAGKEAIIKALSNDNIDFNIITILNDDLGKPYVLINEEIQNNILISLSYEDEYAIAYVIVI